jgi:ABC-2 type transport system permease protein
MKTAYLALETKRAVRNPRALIFTIVFPVVLFLVYKGLYGSGTITVNGRPVSTTAFLMVNMAAFGSFMAAMNTGARTAVERAAGWQRQLRLTPLTPRGYLMAKAGVAMFVALPSVVLVSLVGLASGVHLSGGAWLQVVVGVWVATLPFAVLGLLIGQLATAESLQVYTSGIMLLCSLLGGLWIPITLFPSWLGDIAKVLPSYWLADVGHDALAASNDVGHAVIALAIWAVVLAFLVVRRYQRDSARV